MENSLIEWTDHTFNPVIGCMKVSEGCGHCYAESMNQRWHEGKNWGPGAPRQRTSTDYWKQPLKWNEEARKTMLIYDSEPAHFHYGEQRPRHPRVFCASLADWLDPEWPVEVRADLLALIRKTRNLDWLLLTKRPEQWKTLLDEVLDYEGLPYDDEAPATLSDWILDWYNGKPPANVWIGATAENQRRADERTNELEKIPARVRFLSCEPLLENISLKKALWKNLPISQVPGHVLDDGGYACKEFLEIRGAIHWVICGGESGAYARSMDIAWARSLRDQCKAAGVAFFMKQLGGVTKKRGQLDDFPFDLRVREFPT